MFTKEKLKKWIPTLIHAIVTTNVKDIEVGNPRADENYDLLLDLKRTLVKLYTTMTKED